jgi:GT2 family glycosyltransferase
MEQRAGVSHPANSPARYAGREASRAGSGDEVTDDDQAAALRQLSRRLWQAEVRLDEAARATAASERRLEDVYHSTSWTLTAPLRVFSARNKAAARIIRRGAKAVWWALTLQLPRRLRERREAIAQAGRTPQKRPPEAYADWVREFDTLDDSDIEGMARLYGGLAQRPLVSVLMPVFDPPEDALRAAIESVRAQVYADWELCIADDASTRPYVARVLEEYERLDDRVRVVRRTSNGGISAASNSALELARGELVALLDHDDLLRPHSLLLSVLPFGLDPRVGFVYSDADRVDADGRRVSHHFKPDWSPALLLCQNYLCHLSVIRTELVRAVGGFRSAYDGSQDWDLNLRVTELLPPGGIAHVPHVLYHWRAIPGSVASEGVEAKPYAIEAARRAVEDHLARTGSRGYVLPVAEHQKVRFFLGSPRPRVTVVVPSTGRRELLEPCIDGVLSRTEYDELEVVVAVDERAEEDPSTRRFLAELSSRPRVRLQSYPSRPFNYALTVNEAVAMTDAPFVLLLNDDTKVVYEDWLDAMVGYAQEEERVGAVGGMLVYPDGTIHSAGMLVGARSIAENRYHRRSALVSGHANRARLPQDLTAVVGTCMLVKREAFDEVGGLDVSFPVAYNEVDFCLRLRRAEWRIVYVPDAVLIHHGSASFGTHQRGREEEHERDAALMLERWGDLLLDDPFHNPNLELDASYPSRLASPPRVEYPWRTTYALNSKLHQRRAIKLRSG